MPTIEVNGTGLEYTERGVGEPVVFVHGGLNDLRSLEQANARVRVNVPHGGVQLPLLLPK